MPTLCARIERAASRDGALTFVGTGAPDRVPWARLHHDARGVAAALQARGIGPGDHVAFLAPTSRALVTAIQATWLTGATLVSLPLPMRLGSVDEFVAQTRARVRRADTSLLVVDPELAALLPTDPADPPTLLLSDLAAAGTRRGMAGAWAAPKDDPSALAVLQFTSGSTADPKGVMVPHATCLANLDAAAGVAGLDPDTDVLVSWLPLYHDMGLVGMLTLPMITGADLVLAAPQDFLAAPARWMQWVSDFRGTATAGPNFSWALAARALARGPELDLSSLRLALNGAEPVDPTTVEAFCAAAARHHFDPGAVFCAFGMAELTIAGTFPRPGAGMTVDAIDRRVLETDGYAAPSSADPAAETVRRLARLGRPVPGLRVRVVDPQTGDERREREVGEVQFRGSSVTPGYYHHPEATTAAFHDGWLRTGDLGYLVDGDLVVCGRQKDVIIVGGRNVYPEDVERAVAAVDGVRAGNVIAFGVDGRKGREALVVVAETKVDDPAPVRSAVAQRVRGAVGLPPEVVLVAPGSLPKTSSGKLQRDRCRQRYLAADLTLV